MDQFHQAYEPFHKRAVDLQYKFHDLVDNPFDPTAQVLQHEVHALTEDIAAQKHPRDIEHRIQTIQRQLIEAKALNQSPPLSYQDNEYLHHNYEQMRVDVRRLPNY